MNLAKSKLKVSAKALAKEKLKNDGSATALHLLRCCNMNQNPTLFGKNGIRVNRAEERIYNEMRLGVTHFAQTKYQRDVGQDVPEAPQRSPKVISGRGAMFCKIEFRTSCTTCSPVGREREGEGGGHGARRGRVGQE